MKIKLKSTQLPILVLGISGVCFALRWLLYRVAVDEKNLLLSGHPLEVVLWLLTAAVAAVTVVAAWKLDGSNRYADNFRPSVEAAAGAFLMAVGIGITLLMMGKAGSKLEWVRTGVGCLAAVSLVPAGISRFQGKRPFFVFHCLVCVFFGIYMFCSYRGWCGNPQLQDDVYELFAGVTLALFSYYQAAFDVGSGRRRMQLAMGLLAVFSCITALAHTEHWVLYLTATIWVATNLCSLTPVPRQKRERGAGAPRTKE